MTIELTATKTNLNTLLGVPGQQFVIPEYQRGYAWGDQQVDELWDDLHASMGVGHFMGSVVLNIEDEDRPQVIDGQQRLTTLVILLGLIRDRYHGLGSKYAGQPDQLLLNTFSQGNMAYKLRSGDANWPVLRDFILRSPADDERKVFSQLSSLDKTTRVRNKRLVANAKRLGTSLDEYIKESDNPETALYALEQHVRTGLEFVAIKVGNVSDAFLLFETLNDRGLQLSAADLLKSHLLSKVAQQSKDDATTYEASKSWDKLIDTLGGVDVTRFLRHYLLMSRTKVRKDDVFDEFKKDVAQYGAGKLLARLTDFAQDYGRLLDPAKVEDAAARAALESIHGQNSVTHWVVLLPALHHLSPHDFVRVCRIAEMLSFRWVVCGLNAQELESHYAKAAQVLDMSEGEQVEEVIESLTSVMPSSAQFREGFRQARMGVKYVTRYVLSSIERALNPTSELKTSDEVHIEHIMPKSATPEWESLIGADEEYSDVVARWGNLTLLHQVPNQQISNGGFSAKRELYAKSDIRITSRLARLDEWNSEAIDMRQRWLAVIADQVWSPGSEPVDVPPFPFQDPTLEQQALRELIAKGESHDLEFKSTARWDLRENQRASYIEDQVLKAIAALSNSLGGTLLIGVGDDGEIIGIESDLRTWPKDKRTPDQFMLWLNSKVKQHLGIGVATQIETSVIDSGRGLVCRVDVPESPQPVFLKQKNGKENFFVRMNNASEELQGSDLLEYRQNHW